MISAQQAREKQVSIHWRNNKKLVKAYNRQLEQIMRELEHKINEALVGENKEVTYFMHSEYYDDMKYHAVGSEFSLAVEELHEEAEKILRELGYETGATCRYGVEILDIDWSRDS